MILKVCDVLSLMKHVIAYINRKVTHIYISSLLSIIIHSVCRKSEWKRSRLCYLLLALKRVLFLTLTFLVGRHTLVYIRVYSIHYYMLPLLFEGERETRENDREKEGEE